MNKKQKQGALLVLIGLCMVLAAMFLHTTQERQDMQAGENAAVLLEQLELSRMSVPSPKPTEEAEPIAPQETRMPEKKYLGYTMIGTLRVPAVGIELPILQDWSYPLLNVAPCRYTGSAAEGNMILMGHNYKRHFAPLRQVSPGDRVEFLDASGSSHAYVVAGTEVLKPTQLDELTVSESALTIFTCTPGGYGRFVVRCDPIR